MERVFISLIGFVSLLVCNVFGQRTPMKPPLLGVNFFLADFNTAQRVKMNGAGQLFNPDLQSMKPGLALSYIRGLSPHFDLTVIGGGCFVDYPIKNTPAFGSNSLLLQLSGMVNMKLNTDKKLFTPFITAGLGISKYKVYYGISVPAGLGLQLSFKNEIFVLLQSHYSFAVTTKVSDNLYHCIGIAGNIKKRKQLPQHALPKPQPVNLSLIDRDGDGINDGEDKCPTIPGLTRYAGCPIPDTDNDGINDEEDNCPTVYGVLKYQGCPIPDTDGDGVNDEEDKCITEPGVVGNRGCPVIDTVAIQKINLAAQQIFFETGKATLLKGSYKSLDEIANLLLINPAYKISIEGHTDNQGDNVANQQLSEKRAKTVMLYLAEKGIDQGRMNSKGFGQDRPVDDNGTVDGRAKNRRVEIKINL